MIIDDVLIDVEDLLDMPREDYSNYNLSSFTDEMIDPTASDYLRDIG